MPAATGLYFEDVAINSAIPAVKLTITLQRLVMEAGVNRDFAAIHHNSEVARAHGAADSFANTLFLQGLFERTVRDWMGLSGILRKLSFRMIQFSAVGDVITCQGKVTGKAVQHGEQLVELALWHETDKGVTAKGTALVALPTRS